MYLEGKWATRIKFISEKGLPSESIQNIWCCENKSQKKVCLRNITKVIVLGVEWGLRISRMKIKMQETKLSKARKALGFESWDDWKFRSIILSFRAKNITEALNSSLAIHVVRNWIESGLQSFAECKSLYCFKDFTFALIPWEMCAQVWGNIDLGQAPKGQFGGSFHWFHHQK